MFIITIFGVRSWDMGHEELKNLNNKIYKGLELSFHNLVKRLAAQDGELVVSRNGKIVTVKARDIEKDRNPMK